jgi:hypothetical protein
MIIEIGPNPVSFYSKYYLRARVFKDKSVEAARRGWEMAI